jgi:bifunctional UDP-N-acetylglucosamine pyrophosphorylase/glucosamine-1-phosphate N-acetyltransferase
MIEHLVCAARDAGISEFILVVGYQEQAVREYFGNGSDLGVSVRYATQRRQKGTADALRAAEDKLSGEFLLLNGDMVIRSNAISAIIRKGAPCMGIFHSDHPGDFGVVTTDGGRVTGLEEKSGAPRSNLINAGIYLFSPGIFDALRSIGTSPRGELELTDALAGFIRDGTLRAHTLSFWLDAGYPWDLLDANATLLEDIEPACEGTVEEGVFLHGPVSIGPGTVVRSGTYIEGPCIIGESCRIGPHAYIRGATSIGDRCHIGHSTEIKNSIVMHDTKIPHFNYIGDSIIGSGCNFGAGTKIANLRHDHGPVVIRGINTRREKMGAVIGDEVRFGINCSVNVGSVVGSHVSVAPHTAVEGWVEEETKVR